MKKIKLLTLFLAVSMFAFAQTPYNMQWGSYNQNFNGLANSGTGNTMYPAGWSAFEYGTSSSADGAYRASTGSSTAGDCYSYGAANAAERSLGSQASGSNTPSYGFGFANNTGAILTQIDIALTMEQWREGSGAGLDSCYFMYSTTATDISDTAAAWTALSALDLYSASNTMTSGALDGNLALNQLALSGTISLSLPVNGTIFFKWIDINSAGSDDGLSVDDLSLTLYDANGPLPAGPPALISTSPTDNAVNVPLSTTALTLTIANNIMMLNNAGVARLVDITNSTSVNIPVANISFSGATATLSGITLSSNTDYAVTIDSGILLTNSGAFQGISDSTTWNFKTENTTPPPAVTVLNETFTGCADPVFGVFKAHSEVGAQDWRCTIFGNGDSNAVRMNGFAGGNQINEDWLISPPLDFSAMNFPILEFYSRLRFPANNPRELMISTNYSGLGNPTAATWQAAQVSNWTSLDTTWKKFSYELAQYKASPFHIAFKYTSDTSDADDWYLDDIEVIEGPSAVSTFSADELAIKVLGSVSNVLNMQLTSSKSRNLDYAIMDMAGRVIDKGALNINSGVQNQSLDVSNYSSSMYFLQLSDERSRTSVKFIIR